MALRVWLPLNGNINNYGISDAVVTNNGATVDNNGKIGKCYSFNGSSAKISTQINLTPEMSFCVWVKFNSIQNFVIDARNSSGQGYQPIYISSTGVQIYSSGSPSGGYVNYSFSTGIWYHIVVSYSNNKGYLYVNGMLVGTVGAASLTLNNSILTIGSRYSSERYLNGKLNDVRVYDHALSSKEVKEISKGLCLHYKLAGHGCPNLLTNTGPNDSGWGINQSGGTFTKTITNDCTTFNVTTRATLWFLYYHILPTSVRNSLKVNTTYTYSFEAKSNTNFNLGISLLSGNGTNPMSNQKGIAILGDNQWHKYSVQLTTIADFSTLTQSDQYFYMSGGNVISTTNFRNAKLEEGSIMTPWCPHTSDGLYTALGYNQSIEEDLSGYGNNGVITGSLIPIENSPRYSYAAQRKDLNSYITVPKIFNNNSFTISCWAFASTWETDYFICSIKDITDSWFANIGCNGGKVSQFAVFESNKAIYHCTGTRIANGWHHFVGTFNGTTAKLYIDGVLISSATRSNNTAYTSNISRLYSSSFIGAVSDFRIYATALSDADVLELYNTSLSIDNVGNMYAYEFKEIE